MQCVHVRSIDKYNPKFRDRDLVWCKLYFSTINTDTEFMLLCEVDRWRYFSFVMLELQLKKPVPLDPRFLMMKGFDFKKRSITLTLKMLQELIEVREIVISSRYQDDTLDKELDKELYKEDKELDKNKTRQTPFDMFALSAVASWNSLCDRYPTLKRIREVSPERRGHLKKRFERESFKDFESIVKAIPEQPFLLGNGKSQWIVSFDWIIKNDTNYVKILERGYKDERDGDEHGFRIVKKR